MQHVTQINLDHGDRQVLEALNADGTRWHSELSLSTVTGLSYGFVQSKLKGMRRRGLVTTRHTMAWTREWAITAEGTAVLAGGEQLRLA